jgi:hypothetical protein
VNSDLTLDTAIQNAVNQLSTDLPHGSRIAIVDVTFQSKGIQEYIIYEVEHLLREKRYIIVDRLQLDKARNELMFAMSGEVDEYTAVSIGKFTGATIVITGLIHGESELQRLRLRAIEVETAQVIATASQPVSLSVGNGFIRSDTVPATLPLANVPATLPLAKEENREHRVAMPPPPARSIAGTGRGGIAKFKIKEKIK